jgi:hypothetical protein
MGYAALDDSRVGDRTAVVISNVIAASRSHQSNDHCCDGEAAADDADGVGGSKVPLLPCISSWSIWKAVTTLLVSKLFAPFWLCFALTTARVIFLRSS